MRFGKWANNCRHTKAASNTSSCLQHFTTGLPQSSRAMLRHKQGLFKLLRMNSSPNHTQRGRQLGPPASLEKTRYLRFKLWRTRPEFNCPSLASCCVPTRKWGCRQMAHHRQTACPGRGALQTCVAREVLVDGRTKWIGGHCVWSAARMHGTLRTMGAVCVHVFGFQMEILLLASMSSARACSN